MVIVVLEPLAEDAPLGRDVHRPAGGHLAQGQILGSGLNGDRCSGGQAEVSGGRDEELLGRETWIPERVVKPARCWPNGIVTVWLGPFIPADPGTRRPSPSRSRARRAGRSVRLPDCKSAAGDERRRAGLADAPAASGCNECHVLPGDVRRQDADRCASRGVHCHLGDRVHQHGVVQAASLVRSDTCCEVAT